MKRQLIVLCVSLFATIGSAASASTISISAPAMVTSPFDVLVQAHDLFVGRDAATDIIISFGFNVGVSDPTVITFVGATSGPLFDPATTAPGTAVFAAASGFGIEPGTPEPLILATLHFAVVGSGHANIVISSNQANLFQGLQYFNDPVQEQIAGTVGVEARAATVPEPATLWLSGVGLIVASLARRLRKPE